MEKIADLLTKFMISESSSENLDYEVCKFGLLMAIEVAINTVIALCISFLLGMFSIGVDDVTVDCHFTKISTHIFCF